MTPDDAIREAKSGSLRPVYVLLGEERVLADGVLGAIRAAALVGGVAGFNDDKFTAGEADIEDIINALRTVPMLGKHRFVLVRSLERWETLGGDGTAKRGGERAESAMDRLATYCSKPVDSAVLVLVANKLDGRRRFLTVARKLGCIVNCDPISLKELPRYIHRAVTERGHTIDQKTADLLAQVAGPELGNVLDSIERLSLFVGAGKPITDDAIGECVSRARLSTVWELANSVARHDIAGALGALDDAYDPQDRGLKLVGVFAWSVRQMIKFVNARANGASVDQAAQAAGAGYHAKEMSQKTAHLTIDDLQRWLAVLSETDLALKGSRRTPISILQTAVLTLAQPNPR